MIGVAVSGAEKVLANLNRAVAEVRSQGETAMRAATKFVGHLLYLELTGAESRDPFWGKVGSKGMGLSVRSDKTRASLTPGTRVYREGTTVVGVIGSAEPHLKLHEDGATVSGTSPKGYLRIPTAAAQMHSGVDRYTGIGARDIPGAFILKSKTGNLWIAIRKGKRGVLTLLYLLKKSVTLRPRHIFARVRDQAQPEVVKITDETISAIVRKANT